MYEMQKKNAGESSNTAVDILLLNLKFIMPYTTLVLFLL